MCESNTNSTFCTKTHGKSHCNLFSLQPQTHKLHCEISPNAALMRCVPATESAFLHIQWFVYKRNFFLLSCSYYENLAPDLAGFAIRNLAKTCFSQMWKNQIWYSPIINTSFNYYNYYNRFMPPWTLSGTTRVRMY